MTTYVLSSVFNSGSQFLDNQGRVLAGGKLWTYVAGSTTPLTTYTDSSGRVANANPIILDSAGRVTQEIWFPSGTQIKYVLQDSTGASVGPTVDNVPGLNDNSAIASPGEWVASGATPTFVSSTQFTVSGDLTSTFTVGRRTKSTVTAGTAYSTITASSFGAGVTTVTVLNDSTALDSGLSAVSVGFLSSSAPSIPAILSIVMKAKAWLTNSTTSASGNGMYSQAANQLDWSYNGTRGLTLSAAGLIGYNLHNNATTPTGTTNQPPGMSGTYTPTFSAIANITGTPTVATAPWRWTRSGNVVTVSGQCVANITSGAVATAFNATLPIALGASASGDNSDITGGGSAESSVVAISVNADATTPVKVRVGWTSVGTGNQNVRVIFQYEVKG